MKDTQPRILIVDDNIELCANMCDILEKNDYTVEYANNGKEAIELARNNEYDIAIVDIMLPDISGNEVVREISKVSSSTEFIYMTGNATVDSAIEAVKQEHVISYETKPLDPVHLLAMINQVIERRKVDEALKLFKVLIDQTTDAVFMKDVSGRYVMINSAGANIIGKPINEIVGKDDAQLFPYDVACKLIEMDQKIVASGKGEVFDEEVPGSGNIRVLQTSKVPYRSNSGNIIGIIGVSRDITERKRIDNELKQKEYYLEKAQEIAIIGTWELDMNKNKLVWTDENYRIFGIPADTKLTYEIFLDCVHPDDRDYVDREWKAFLNKKPYDIEHRIIVGGKVKWVREKADLKFDEEGNCVSGIGYCTQECRRTNQGITQREGSTLEGDSSQG